MLSQSGRSWRQTSRPLSSLITFYRYKSLLGEKAPVKATKSGPYQGDRGPTPAWSGQSAKASLSTLAAAAGSSAL